MLHNNAERLMTISSEMTPSQKQRFERTGSASGACYYSDVFASYLPVPYVYNVAASGVRTRQCTAKVFTLAKFRFMKYCRIYVASSCCTRKFPISQTKEQMMHTAESTLKKTSKRRRAPNIEIRYSAGDYGSMRIDTVRGRREAENDKGS